MQNCGVLAENAAFDGGHQKKSLHPSSRMAWKNFRHGEAGNFPSPHKKTRHSSPNPSVPIKFYKISKNISVFILLLQNKALSLQWNWRPLLPIRASPPLWGELAIGRCRERVGNSEARLTREKKANGQKPTPSTVILNLFQDLSADKNKKDSRWDAETSSAWQQNEPTAKS